MSGRESYTFTASAARQMTVTAKVPPEQVFTAITRCASEGKFSSTAADLSPSEVAWLQKNGYTVELHDSPRESYYEIHW